MNLNKSIDCVVMIFFTCFSKPVLSMQQLETSMDIILIQCSISIPPENIRKLEVF